MIAQDVVAAFEAQGLTATDYGVVTLDTWDAREAVVDEQSGEEITPAVPAGSRYAVRYDELHSLIIAAMDSE